MANSVIYVITLPRLYLEIVPVFTKLYKDIPLKRYDYGSNVLQDYNKESNLWKGDADTL